MAVKSYNRMSNGEVLIIEDNMDILLSAELLLKKYFKRVTTYDNPEEAVAHIRFQKYDVVLLDMNFSRGETSGKEGVYWLKKIREIQPDTVVVMITAFGDLDLAIKTIKAGAMDFVLKPWQNEKLITTVMAAYDLSQNKQKVHELEERHKAFTKAEETEVQPLLGISKPMQQLMEMTKKVAATDANILLLGENGTGKEVVARFIHQHSTRHNNVFVKVDLGSIPETLFESELFGYVKGAFTDAKEDRPGRFEMATGGTLFLDEIGNLSLSMQTKLLTVLQNREVIRLGSNKSRPIDIRLICATNMPIHEMTSSTTFRRDLLYRINTVEAHVPALRERIEDIAIIASHYLDLYARKYNKPGLKLTTPMIQALNKYQWPGNVRELQHSIERAVILCDGVQLDLSFLVPGALNGERSGEAVNTLNLDEIEKTAIQKALKIHRGNISHAAKELGLTRASLYRRIEKYGI